MSYTKTWNGPTTFTNIVPNKGTGFILVRLAYLKEATRREVYAGTNYERRYGYDGYHSLLWKALLDNNLVKCTNGRECGQKWWNFWGRTISTAIKAWKRETPRYALTDEGVKVLMEMIDRARK